MSESTYLRERAAEAERDSERQGDGICCDLCDTRIGADTYESQYGLCAQHWAEYCASISRELTR